MVIIFWQFRPAHDALSLSRVFGVVFSPLEQERLCQYDGLTVPYGKCGITEWFLRFDQLHKFGLQ